MAKTTRRPRTEHDTTVAHDMRNPSLPSAVRDSDIAHRAYELYEGVAESTDATWKTGCSRRTNCEMRRGPPQHDCAGRSA
jgi:hypothetical protein